MFLRAEGFRCETHSGPDQGDVFLYTLSGILQISGLVEVVIGLGLIFKVALRATLAFLWLQMAGTFVAPILQPGIF